MKLSRKSRSEAGTRPMTKILSIRRFYQILHTIQNNGGHFVSSQGYASRGFGAKRRTLIHKVHTGNKRSENKGTGKREGDNVGDVWISKERQC